MTVTVTEPADRPRLTYIIIEVREPEREPHRKSDAGFLRHAIHAIIGDLEIDAADMLIRFDQKQTYYGVSNRWDEIRALYEAVVPEKFRKGRTAEDRRLQACPGHDMLGRRQRKDRDMRAAKTAAVIAIAAGALAGLAGGSQAATKSPAASCTNAQDIAWLNSEGGQDQDIINDQVSTLAYALYVESGDPSAANHLKFEADARAVRASADYVLAHPSLEPQHVGKAGYVSWLNDLVVVADLLQPGPGYGTTAQDDAAWTKAMDASDAQAC
jgi:hypothetical protein